MWKFIGGIVSLIVLYFIVILPIFGLHINTGSGNHVGYVTAVEKGGLIFKTGTAYFKTDAQSSQEDDYCVIDESLLPVLKDVAEKRVKVEISYFGYFSAGIVNCNGEGAIISAVKELN